jgi:predicted O-methyltransferase YrrM
VIHESPLPFHRAKAQSLGLTTQSLHELESIDSWGRILAAYDAPSLTSHAERVFTYGLILAKRPERVLEIGFRYGGSSFLMLCALQDAERGRLVSIDPHPDPVVDFARFGDRFTLIRGASPLEVPKAVQTLGGPVDLCFVDGDHSYAAVLADLFAIEPHMANDSYALLHDASFPDVQRATDEFLNRHRNRVIDCGLVCPLTSADGWSGLRMLRFVNRR